MLRLTIPAGIPEQIPIQFGRNLLPGKSYLCSARFTGGMLLSQWRVTFNGHQVPLRTLLKVESWIGIKPFMLPSGNWNDRDLWLVRGGGWGDLLALTPVIKEINQRWPTCRLHVAIGKQYFGLFHGLNVIEELMPVPYDPLLNLISFEELIESSPDSEKVHIIDLFAKRTGVELRDRKIHYQITEPEASVATIEFPRTEKDRIGIQFLASALYRSYPRMQFVIKELAKDHEVFIFGFPKQVQFKPHPNVVNLMDLSLTFRQSAAVLATCDVVIAPDSALVHLCSALDIPCIALYGPIPSHLRVSGTSIYPLDGEAPCAPCFFHATRSIDFPAGKPCTDISRCVALESIPVEKIVELVYSLKTETPRRR